VERGGRQEGNPAASLDQGMVDCNQRDEAEEEQLHHFAQPNAARTKEPNLFAEYRYHEQLLFRLIAHSVIFICAISKKGL
jgi:hypothetical protein